MIVVKKKRITCERTFDYPVEMIDEDVLDLFSKQIIDAASCLSSKDIDIVEVDNVSEYDKSMEKLFEKWVIYLQKLDVSHKGFEVFADKSDKLDIESLRDIIKGGSDVLEEKVDDLRDINEYAEYHMFKDTLGAFLCDEGVDENVIDDEEKFREEFESHVLWNIEKLFDFPVLLRDARTYEVKYNGVNNEIDESVQEQKEFKYKALKFISKEQLEEILANSWGGSGFFGIIISGKDIIEAINEKKRVVSGSEMVIGVHDGFNGSGYFKKVNISKDRDGKVYRIALYKSDLDFGNYSLGAVFGDTEWTWG